VLNFSLSIQEIKKSQRAFTLIELLVTVSLIIIFTATAVGYNRKIDQQIALFREQGRVINEVYKVRSLAITTYNRADNSQVPCGYGIHIPQDAQGTSRMLVIKEPASVTQDCTSFDSFLPLYDDQSVFDEQNKKVEEVVFSGVTIQANVSDILFVPPDPKVYAFGQTAGTLFPVVITIQTQAGFGSIISINEFGQITTTTF